MHIQTAPALRRLLLATTAIGMIAALPASPPAKAEIRQVAQQTARQQFDIPAQPLSGALNRLGEAANLQILYPAALVEGLRAERLAGDYSAEEALRMLLRGTGLSYRFTAERIVTLEKPAATGALTLDPVTVEASLRNTETATSPVQGYLARRSATATKTDTPILETPASVQVVPRQVIEDQGALNLKDVYENVSGVHQAGNTLNAQTEVLPIIRGFESPTLLRNGLRSTQSGAVDLVNVERVEVLKGPSSILYGALEPGGIVNYVTKRPQAVAAHEVEQQVGADSFYRTTLDSTGPVSANGELMYRINAAYTDSGSFRDYMELERTAVAPSLLWQPDDRTEILLDLSYLHEEQPYDTGIPLGTDGKRLTARESFFNDPDLAGREIDDYTASYQLTHQLSDVWSLRNQLQFHRAEAKNESLRPRGVTGPAGSEQLALRYQNEDRQDDEIQLVLDATATFATGAVDHTLLIGAELIRQETDFRRYRQNVASVPITDDPMVNFDPPASQPKSVQLGKTDWASIYVQDQVSLLQDGRLKLLLGGRFDVVRQENETDGVASPDVNDEAFSGRAGLLYQFTDRYSGYMSVSQSFQPQSPGTLDIGGTALDPEEGLQVEVGVKAAFLNERLLATASIFQIEKENVAVIDSDLFQSTGQIAYYPGVEQRSRGFEIDLTGALTEEINILANYTFLDTEVIQNLGDPTSVGDPLGSVPRHKVRLWLTYDFADASPLGGLGFGGGARYVGASTAQFDTDLKLSSYTVVDAAAWYEWQSMRFGLNIYNLFDEDYIVRASDRSIAHPGQPLTAIASVSVRF
ncbi:MAG: TonB-dependent siderophore receptor [Oceanibaculum nanhaiense]|jgi:iron complex outermembrane receptor protein|uniref:TonB-dependent siderophore receptor n=1 Tax=Oceanibaculum nanhaiense TaxID=1909734 RepID=UPI0032EC235B